VRPEAGPLASAPQSNGAEEDEAAPAWPGETDEAAFLAESSEKQASESADRAPARDEEAAEAGLPALGGLVERVPREVRNLLDELFRAKFTAVRRISPRRKSAEQGFGVGGQAGP